MNASTGKWILAAGLALWLCARGAANRRPAQPDAPKAGDSKPAVYYAGQDGLPLYPEASFRGDPLARLPLNEKLLRTRQQGGFAFVTVERTGQTGWEVLVEAIGPRPPTPRQVAVAQKRLAPLVNQPVALDVRFRAEFMVNGQGYYSSEADKDR